MFYAQVSFETTEHTYNSIMHVALSKYGHVGLDIREIHCDGLSGREIIMRKFFFS